MSVDAVVPNTDFDTDAAVVPQKGERGAWRTEALHDERLARLVWAHIAEPRDAKAVAVINDVGHCAGLAHVDSDERLAAFALRLRELDLDEQMRRLAKLNVRVLTPADDEWPHGVDELPEPPHCLFVVGSGNLAELSEGSVALVGARAATQYGARLAGTLAIEMGDHKRAVISGGAFGIDAAAHRGALYAERGTVCVLACGVDRVYPAAHEKLFSAIRKGGVIVSEMPLGFSPMRQRFLHRNRLIAAMASGTVVVEAGIRSGALSTARHAAELNRPVGAVPGPVTSAASAGCHEILRQQLAVLVTGGGDVEELVGPYGATATTCDSLPALIKAEDVLSPPAKLVWDAMPLRRATSIDNIARTAGVTVNQVSAALGELEMARMAVRDEGGWRKSSR